jgi:hypothetical protein
MTRTNQEIFYGLAKKRDALMQHLGVPSGHTHGARINSFDVGDITEKAQPRPGQNHDIAASRCSSFEQQILPAEYKNYYRTKRNNLFASIQKLPELWEYYMLLDKIWVYEMVALR